MVLNKITWKKYLEKRRDLSLSWMDGYSPDASSLFRLYIYFMIREYEKE